MAYFKDATFTRSSVAWYSVTPSLAVGSMVQAAVNEPRIRSVSGMREYLGELSRSNFIAGDSSRLNSVSWSISTGSATINSQAESSVFKDELADRVNFAASTLSRLTTNIQNTTDGMVVVISMIARTTTGTANMAFVVTKRDGTTAQVGTSFTVDTTPKVIYRSVNLLTGTIQPKVHIQYNSQTPANPVIIDHAQVEDQGVGVARASSPIRKSDGSPVTRSTDKMVFQVPQAMINGVWHIRARFDHASTEPLGNQTLYAWGGGDFVHLNGGNSLRCRDVSAGSGFATGPFSFSQGDVRNLFGDFRSSSNSALRVEDASGTTLTSTTTTIGPQFTTGNIEYGQAPTAGANLNINLGLWLSEPRMGKPLV